jgi:GT2 family glycosyltransferase
MGISVIIPHWGYSDEINETLQKCVNSLGDGKEIFIMQNEGDGFAKNVNLGLKQVSGDYLMVVNNDIVWDYGNIEDLCIPGTVTSPKVNGDSQPFWGCFFCIPREVYEKIGGLDEQFGVGYYEDDDYIKRLEEAGIPMKCVETCNITSKGGQTMKMFDTDTLMKENKIKFDNKWQKKQ